MSGQVPRRRKRKRQWNSSQAKKLDFMSQAHGKPSLTQTELNTLVARYVVEDMLPLSTVESESFKALVAKIPVRGGVSF